MPYSGAYRLNWLPLASMAALLLYLLSPDPVYAGSSAWSPNPTSNDWNTAANWMPTTVPQRPGDTTTFAVSNTTEIALSLFATVDSVVFEPNASSYTITAAEQLFFTVSGTGIVNNSGITQKFIVPAGEHVTYMVFNNSASLGSMVEITNNAFLIFNATSNAGSGNFLTQS